MQAAQDGKLGSVANTVLNTSRQPSDPPGRLVRSQENTSREEVASGSEKPCLYFHEATFLILASGHLFILRLRRGAIWLLKSIHEDRFHVVPKLTEKKGGGPAILSIGFIQDYIIWKTEKNSSDLICILNYATSLLY